ncbi:MAG: glycosyltransferase [Actinomycetota bacterium]|nr:glycosyltransferase [Actinomycetota bacterium]
MSPSIVFVPGVPGGTAQYRCYVPGRALERAGWDVRFVEDSEELTRLPECDVLVVSRGRSLELPHLFRLFRARGTACVYDIDDLVHEIPTYNPAAHEDYSAVIPAMREADLITCSTPGLARYYGEHGRIAVLPNLLDPELWEDVERYRVPHDSVRVGWMAFWQWRGGDVEVLRPWLADWLRAHPEVEFVALGCPEIAAELDITVLSPRPDEETVGSARPWQHVPAMCALLDVGLAPLARNRFNWQAKSACKALEYTAAGVPVVASPSEAYRDFIRPGVNGYLAKRDWWAVMDRTLDGLDVLREGARKVAAEYVIDDHVDKWTTAYEEARACRSL